MFASPEKYSRRGYSVTHTESNVNLSAFGTVRVDGAPAKGDVDRLCEEARADLLALPEAQGYPVLRVDKSQSTFPERTFNVQLVLVTEKAPGPTPVK